MLSMRGRTVFWGFGLSHCLVVWHRIRVRDKGKIIKKTICLCVGLKQNGLKEVFFSEVANRNDILSGWGQTN